MSRSNARAIAGQHRRRWVLLLLLGAAWMIAAWSGPRLDTESVDQAAWLAGGLLIFAAGAELARASLAPTWRKLHGGLAILSAVVGVVAVGIPAGSVVDLAALVGFFLLVRGGVDVAVAAATRATEPAWGAQLAVGAGEALVGLWAAARFVESTNMLVATLGTFALLRGIAEIISALRMRDARPALKPASYAAGQADYAAAGQADYAAAGRPVARHRADESVGEAAATPGAAVAQPVSVGAGSSAGMAPGRSLATFPVAGSAPAPPGSRGSSGTMYQAGGGFSPPPADDEPDDEPDAGLELADAEPDDADSVPSGSWRPYDPRATPATGLPDHPSGGDRALSGGAHEATAARPALDADLISDDGYVGRRRTPEALLGSAPVGEDDQDRDLFGASGQPAPAGPSIKLPSLGAGDVTAPAVQLAHPQTPRPQPSGLPPIVGRPLPTPPGRQPDPAPPRPASGLPPLTGRPVPAVPREQELPRPPSGLPPLAGTARQGVGQGGPPPPGQGQAWPPSATSLPPLYPPIGSGTAWEQGGVRAGMRIPAGSPATNPTAVGPADPATAAPDAPPPGAPPAGRRVPGDPVTHRSPVPQVQQGQPDGGQQGSGQQARSESWFSRRSGRRRSE